MKFQNVSNIIEALRDICIIVHISYISALDQYLLSYVIIIFVNFLGNTIQRADMIVQLNSCYKIWSV